MSLTTFMRCSACDETIPDYNARYCDFCDTVFCNRCYDQHECESKQNVSSKIFECDSEEFGICD